MKNILYFIALVFFVVAAYVLYGWYKNDPHKFDAKYAVASFIPTFIMFVIAWRFTDNPTSDETTSQTSARQYNLFSAEGRNNISKSIGKIFQLNIGSRGGSNTVDNKDQ